MSTSKTKADIESLLKGAMLCDRNGHKGDAEQIRDLVKELEGASPEKLMCEKCSAMRKPDADGKCWKCHGAMFKPVREWEEPPCYDVNMIRLIARDMGYAIAEHGSKERDQDLIAIPWSENACSASELVRFIAKHLEGRVAETEDKPNGRFAATIQANGWFKPIDISVMGPNRRPHFYGDEMRAVPGQHGGLRTDHPYNPAIPRSDGLLRTVVYDTPHLFQPQYQHTPPGVCTPGGYPVHGVASETREDPAQRPDASPVSEP